jgi:hypothetical protein
MHVDGGATSQVVLISPQVPIAEITRQRLGRNIDRRLWVIINNRGLPPPAIVGPRIGPIATATVSALVRGSGIGDAYKLYLIAERDEIAYHAAWVPQTIPCVSNEDFDPVYMRCMFDLGGQEFRRGTLWSDLPPQAHGASRGTSSAGAPSLACLFLRQCPALRRPSTTTAIRSGCTLRVAIPAAA